MDTVVDKVSLFSKFATIMDRNTRGVQIGIYSVAVLGLAVAIRTVRPFSRFVKPSDIPGTFFSSRIKLNGKVTKLDYSAGALLVVQHRPLVPFLSLPKSSEGLPIRVAGVNITGNGVNWLQTICVGKDILFTPLLKQSHYVVSEVLMTYSPYEAKKPITLNIGEELVALGFGTVAVMDPYLSRNEHYLAYYKKLLQAEKRAERRRMGVWLNNPSPPWHSRLIAELWARTKHTLSPRFNSA